MYSLSLLQHLALFIFIFSFLSVNKVSLNKVTIKFDQILILIGFKLITNKKFNILIGSLFILIN